MSVWVRVFASFVALGCGIAAVVVVALLARSVFG
jgi:hypothetical protein